MNDLNREDAITLAYCANHFYSQPFSSQNKHIWMSIEVLYIRALPKSSPFCL